MEKTEKLIEIKDLCVEFKTVEGTVKAVNHLNYTLHKGEKLGIVGESGSGKSVSSLGMMKLIPNPPGEITCGEILYKGRDLVKESEAEMQKIRGNDISMIFQEPMTSLNPIIKCGRQIAEALTLHRGMKKKEAMEEAIEMMKAVGIANPEVRAHEYPHQMSGGMRQRVMIAMAMITKPKMLIADEPTTSLDVTIQAQILELMQELQEETGMSILMITHDMGVVADIADEIIVMYAGKIVERGACRDIFYHPQHPYTWSLLNSVPRIDTGEDKKLVTIEGNIPDMTCPPKGCGFCERCPYAMNVCREYMPDAAKVSDGHEVWCWLTDKRADLSGIPFQIETDRTAKERKLVSENRAKEESEQKAVCREENR